MKVGFPFTNMGERMTHLGIGLIVGICFLFACAACERQGAPPKPIGSATNKHVEETPARPSALDADAMTHNMKTPMDNARQTEDQLKQSGDRIRQQSEPATP